MPIRSFLLEKPIVGLYCFRNVLYKR